MTISSETRKAGPFIGDGLVTDFPFTFKVFVEADLYVVLLDADGVETVKALTTHYTVALNADQDSNPGGTVTMLTAPATGETLTLSSAVALLQSVDIQNMGGFYPSVINKALDRLTIFTQQLTEKIGRAALAPFSSTAADRANTITGFDADGEPLLYSLDALESIGVAQVIDVDSTDAALRITQRGTGNAFVVEDSTNPDSTPFTIDGSGNVSVGGTFDVAGAASVSSTLNVTGVTTLGAALKEKVVDLAAGTDIDASLGSLYITTPGADKDVTVSNVVACTSFTLQVSNGGVTARQLTFTTGFGSLRWPGGVQPTETTGVDVYTFYSPDGTIIRGALVASYPS